MGKGCGVIFFGIFAVMGLAVTVFLSVALFQSARSYTWDETPCEILSSAVTETGREYTLDVTYRYRVGGREYTSNTFAIDGHKFKKSRDAQRALKRFPAETSGTCYVNPSAPTQAVLERGDLWMGFFLIIPLIFVAVGVGGIIGVLRNKEPSEAALSERHLARKTGCGPLGMRLFGLVFILAGGAAMYAMLIGPWLTSRKAKDWKEVPCTITSSRVESHRGDDSTTYSIDIRYRYQWDGRDMTGDQFNFQPGSSSSIEWKRAVVKQHPAGRDTVCFVNPEDPAESVLSRELDNDWWFGLIPGIFILAGSGVFFAAGRLGTKRAVVPSIAAATRIPAGGRDGTGPVTLKPASTPRTAFIGMTIFALFWNGITWAILLGSDIDGFGRAFLAIFALIGILVALGAVYFLLALFNPRPELTVSSDTVLPGAELKVDYRFTGNAHRITGLTITLEGRESATYRRGTDTTTDRSAFAQLRLLETSERSEISRGTARLLMPADALHTFKSANNEIAWVLRIHGDIAKWPDVDLQFPIEVLPAAPTAPAPPPEPGQPALTGDGPLRIGFRGGRTVFRPGETIEGAALWELDAAPELAEIRLLWFTRGKGTEDGEVVATQRFDAPAAGDTRAFSLTLPPAPFSFSGRLVSVLWAVELVVKPGTRFVRAEIVCSPLEAEIRLPEIPQPKWRGFNLQRS